ncbi:MAG: hypothetical protein H8E19_02815 [Deltaproteobacteria bacterium]|uniref:Uncharacterized protein n=1 Tax=Candidatus Desulfacyla euxinica TaxID=2841693 RepID=A0A8J6MZI3_9DELT|nr:hypothetical protein [Candidatus Desulfacyla euxinica]
MIAPAALTPNTSVPDEFLTNNAEVDEGMVVVVVAEVVVVVAAVVVVVVVAAVVVVVVALLHWEHRNVPPVPYPVEQQLPPEGGQRT